MSQQQFAREGQIMAMQAQQQFECQEERDAHAETLLLQCLARARDGFVAIRSVPDQAVFLAKQNEGWIEALQLEFRRKKQAKEDEAQRAADKLEREAQEQQAKLEREAREKQAKAEREQREKQVQAEEEARRRVEQATVRSRSDRIDLAQRSIKHVTSSLRSARDRRIGLIVCLCVLPFASARFSDPAVGAVVVCVAWPVAYHVYSHLPGINTKIRWMEIYEQSLDSLRKNPQMTVRQAVAQRIAVDAANKPAHQRTVDIVLAKIADDRVEGDPREVLITIPAPLETLLVHANQSSDDFFGMSLA
jgi:flagellar biosynthesis GTPase FlhF